MFQNVRPLLHDQVDVPQRDVLHFRLRRQQRNERRGQLLAERGAELGIARAEHLHQLHQDLNGRQDDGGVRVRQPRRDPLANALRLPFVLRLVVREAVQDEHLAPFGALVQRRQQLVDRARVHLDQRAAGRAALVDLGQGGDGVRDDHRVRIGQQLAQLLEEALILDQAGADVVQLRDAHRRGLPHVRVLVFEAFAQRLAEVLCYFVDADAAHGADGEGADQRVRVLAVLGKTGNREHVALLRHRVTDEAIVCWMCKR